MPFYKNTYLKLGTIDDLSIGRGIEVADFSFYFNQGLDYKGQPSTDIKGGGFSLILPNLPPPEIMKWGIENGKYCNGLIYMIGLTQDDIKSILFTKASCVEFSIRFSSRSYASTHLSIMAQELKIGSLSGFYNMW